MTMYFTCQLCTLYSLIAEIDLQYMHGHLGMVPMHACHFETYRPHFKGLEVCTLHSDTCNTRIDINHLQFDKRRSS